ncbi:MAG: hypothetical protein PVH29_09300 [Candidatus Zixiibacteriota bacterium]|jgi:hypothetical protein
MSLIKGITSYVAIVSLVAAGLVLSGAAPAGAATGGTGGGEEEDDGIGAPIFGLIAIAGIATVAIWQNIALAKKKKEAKLKAEEEDKEAEEYEEYFEFGEEDPEEAESRNVEEIDEGADLSTAAAVSAE